jgi:hypothetical protein
MFFFLLYAMAFAIICDNVAMRRHQKGPWFLWGFLFGVIALGVLLSKPESLEAQRQRMNEEFAREQRIARSVAEQRMGGPQKEAPSRSVEERLERIKALHERGAISSAEYEEKRKQLLAEL